MIVYKNQILNSVEDRKSTSCFLPISMGTIANSLNLCASMLMLMPLTISLPCLIKPDLFISMIYKRLLSFRLCSLRENEDLFPIRVSMPIARDRQLVKLFWIKFMLDIQLWIGGGN